MLRVYAPATSANLNVGFDSLGIALSPIDGSLLGDVVQIESLEKGFALENAGSFAEYLPQNPKENIVYQAYVLFMERIKARGLAERSLKLTLEKNMPIGSGLGSSACSIVAALVALNHFYDNPLSQATLLKMMGELEGRISGSIHYDNVAPSFLGGLQLMLPEGEAGNDISQNLPCFDNWYWVLAYSGIKVATAEARSILPTSYSKETLIKQARYFAAFTHACHSGQEELAANMMQDLIAEPYRASLLPNFVQSKEGVKNLGALACGISGSGPTMFAIAPNLTTANQIAAYLEKHYLQNSQGFVHICQVNKQGAQLLNI